MPRKRTQKPRQPPLAGNRKLFKKNGQPTAGAKGLAKKAALGLGALAALTYAAKRPGSAASSLARARAATTGFDGLYNDSDFPTGFGAGRKKKRKPRH